MTLAAVNGFPIRIPAFPFQRGPDEAWINSVIGGQIDTVDAAGEKFAFVGTLWLAGGATGKTFSSSGGVIRFFVGSPITFSNAGTTLRVGIQDTTQASALIAPDDTFDVYDDLVGGTDTITATTDHAVTMSSGSKSISTGDKIAVVFSMTSRGGSDSVRIGTVNSSDQAYLANPGCMFHNGTSWSTVTGLVGWAVPNVLLITDDGTCGIIEGGMWAVPPIATHANVQSSSNPDEYGFLFTPPFAMTLYGVEFPVKGVGGGASGTRATAALYSGSAASPSLVESVDIDGFSVFSADAFHGYRTLVRFATPRDLTAGTTYMLTFRATSTMTFTHEYLDYSANSHLFWLPFGTGGYKVSRDGGSGAFTETTDHLYPVTLLASKLSDNAGSAGGLLTHPGMAGGMRG